MESKFKKGLLLASLALASLGLAACGEEKTTASQTQAPAAQTQTDKAATKADAAKPAADAAKQDAAKSDKDQSAKPSLPTQSETKTPMTAEQVKFIRTYAFLAVQELQKSLNLTPEELKEFAQAATEFANGADFKVTDEEREQTARAISARGQKVAADAYAKVTAENLEAGKKYYEEFKKQPGVVEDEKGFLYRVDEEGKGDQVKDSDAVSVTYKGQLVDGTVFDKQEDEAKPVEFPLDGVIAGFKYALTKVKVGSTVTFVLPPELGYGAQGAGPIIGPNSYLQFTVKVLKTRDAKQAFGGK